ncbi:glycine cleavage system aminomethyltransferase GcvT [Roseiflexus sp.]|uniref:glycine cleavage system aminomethyltransferase GcvT n=1 Tax=Roseiflexus sp. TaxID=2562120 RepID=UPI0021DC84DA|nr:glycine cleavage system aminomethyltransferase GcvT [Roseiflexus sp.]GIW01317.1 MAG: aminomethyltransferase [Roseiflexus sp.]
MSNDGGLRRTPLYERHVALGARMVEFGGWEMPVQYSGIIDEHRAVREAVGLFDISHMGEVEVRGPDALPFLQHLVTYDVAAIQPGEANYALMCLPNGGIIDDTFIYNLGDYYLIVVNAANTAKDVAWMHECAKGFQVMVADASDRTGMLALQGPAAEGLLAQVAGADLAALPFHGVRRGTVSGIPAIVARTGYTGEDGFELFVAADDVGRLWDALLNAGRDAGLKPCGLGARDSLRFEACLALYGHEITEETNPYEARLGWVVKLDKGDFIGRDALQRIKQEGVRRRLTGFEMVGRGIARSEYEIRDLEGMPVGRVTSGMPSPTLEKNLGMGYVPVTLSAEGSEFDVVVRDRPVRARVVKMPFYRPRYKK